MYSILIQNKWCKYNLYYLVLGVMVFGFGVEGVHKQRRFHNEKNRHLRQGFAIFLKQLLKIEKKTLFKRKVFFRGVLGREMVEHVEKYIVHRVRRLLKYHTKNVISSTVEAIGNYRWTTIIIMEMIMEMYSISILRSSILWSSIHTW